MKCPACNRDFSLLIEVLGHCREAHTILIDREIDALTIAKLDREHIERLAVAKRLKPLKRNFKRTHDPKPEDSAAGDFLDAARDIQGSPGGGRESAD